MHSMSNLFYDYLSERLIQYFNTSSLVGGERYYFQLDSLEQVETFYERLKEKGDTPLFLYQTPSNVQYETYQLKTQSGIRVVVAATIDGITPDFLVTLRNKVSEQMDEWENTALLSICFENLDSIRGGSSDLQKEGMPFHIKTISKTLESEINESKLSKAEKQVAKFYLEKKLDDLVYQPNLWDYEEVLALIARGSIPRENFSSLGLFYDEHLEQHNVQTMRHRLEENYELFDKVKNIHEYNQENQLEKYFDEKGMKQLKQEEWKEIPYIDVKTSYENKKIAAKKIVEYQESIEKRTKEGLVYWEKAQSNTKAGKRKRHIIVFNPNRMEKVELFFQFDEFLKDQYIAPKSKTYCEVKGKKLMVTLSGHHDQVKIFQITYRHQNQTASEYKFFITIVHCEPEDLKSIKTNYLLKKDSIEITNNEDTLVFGMGKAAEMIRVEEANQIVSVSDEDSVEVQFSSSAFIDTYLPFQVVLNEQTILFKMKDEALKPVPVDGYRIWKLKREAKQHVVLEDNRLYLDTDVFYIKDHYKKLLAIEEQWINGNIHSGIVEGDHIRSEHLELPLDVLNAYDAYISYFKNHQLLPSLAYFDAELEQLAIAFIEAFNREIERIPEDSILTNEQKNLWKIGQLYKENEVIFTPLHPINIAYQLEVNRQLQSEKVDNTILKRLNPMNLLPYISNEEDHLATPTMNETSPEWLVYQPLQQVSVGEMNQYLSTVVFDKVTQFIEHFHYLFSPQSHAPIKLNVINIANDKEIVRGICQFIKHQIDKKGPQQIIPVEVYLYHEEIIKSEFEVFSDIEDIDHILDYFKLNLTTEKFDPSDILRFIRENITYYKITNLQDIRYAHISFYKMVIDHHSVKNKMSEMDTGLSLDGLLSSLTTATINDDYRTGFGMKGVKKPSTLLIKTAYRLNELSSNLMNQGSNPYNKDETIVTKISKENDLNLKKIYDASFWVTFIDPNVNLDYFQKDDFHDLVVIHYSDQYTSSERYDAITVTNKVTQFTDIISEFLHSKQIEVNHIEMEKVIYTFNMINGEWLLRIINEKGQMTREKLSLVSALKYAMAILNHPKIAFIPISLEEILRVAGAVGLPKVAGIFSAKNLGATGIHSDDLLLMGLEDKDRELYMHFYPVEVKIGYNDQTTLEKAKIQIHKTRQLFDEHLRKTNDEGEFLFRNKFFRNFFIQLFLANASKLKAYQLDDSLPYEWIESCKLRLLNDDFEIGYHLFDKIGEGAVLSFKKDASWRSIVKEDRVFIINLIEEDGYEGIVYDIPTLKEEFKKNKTEISKEMLLSYRYQVEEPNKVEFSPIEKDEKTIKVIQEPESEKIADARTTYDDSLKGKESTEKFKKVEKEEIKDIRVLIGKAEGSEKEVYWEFNHKNLGNRHLLISGRSGQGKSYFIQCLLLELAEQGVSSLIFDYTDGFTPDKIEPELQEVLGDRLQQKIVIADKFPLNPFKKQVKEIGSIIIPHDHVDVAERLKGTFANVYRNLGPQQQNVIYEAVKNGVLKYGEQMTLPYLAEEIKEIGTSNAETVLSRIQLFIDKNPFNYDENFDWDILDSKEGNVIIIQLTGYTREIQMMITEFILWDLWYYKLQKGHQSNPFPVILDEAQNLDHSTNSPTYKILREGRKFGWSGWFATQNLSSQFTKEELGNLQQASEKIYFAQVENEVSYTAKNIAKSVQEREHWEQKIRELSLGKCIVQGPMLNEQKELIHHTPTVVHITPLAERVLRFK